MRFASLFALDTPAAAAWPLLALLGCAGSLDEGLDQRECSADGRCLPGYACSVDRICVRESELDSPSERRDAGSRARDAAASTPESVTSAALRDAGREPPAEHAGAGGNAGERAQPPAAGATAKPSQPSAAGATATPSRPATAGATSTPSQPSAAGATASQPTTAGAAGASSQAGAASQPPAAGVAGSETAPAPASPKAPPNGPVMDPTPPAGPAKCMAPQKMCDGSCVDLESNPDHCGNCGKACKADERCEASKCRHERNEPN